VGCLAVGKPGFEPRLVVFDKDGTLIDFHAMWSVWIEALAQTLERAADQPLIGAIYAVVQYDAVRRRAVAGGALAIAPMRDLRRMVTDTLVGAGVERPRAEEVIQKNWFVPDPAAMASPLADLHGLFAALRGCGIQVAVATSDDRAATLATLAALGLEPWVAACACADDAIQPKPAPDMLLALCRTLDVRPAQTLVVGDSAADLRMGLAAGVGMRVGVLSGISDRAALAPFADTIIRSVAELVTSVPIIVSER
jgi:phosphoglycolate phosphatase-like HAD superfamily hydrolase